MQGRGDINKAAFPVNYQNNHSDKQEPQPGEGFTAGISFIISPAVVSAIVKM